MRRFEVTPLSKAGSECLAHGLSLFQVQARICSYQCDTLLHQWPLSKNCTPQMVAQGQGEIGGWVACCLFRISQTSRRRLDDYVALRRMDNVEIKCSCTFILFFTFFDHRTFVYRPNFSTYSTNMDRLTEHTYPTTLQKLCRMDPMSANAVKQNSKRQNTCALAKGTPKLNRQSGPTSA